MSGKILNEITDFYVKSRDFNGIPLTVLIERLSLSWPQLRQRLTQLIESEKVSLAFASVHPNPHIKAFPDLAATQ